MTSQVEPQTTSSTPKILICDDDTDARVIVRHALVALGFDVIEAAGGQEAIDICKASLPDVVVMDIMMPEVTGHDFLRWLRNYQTEVFVPVLFLTALTEINDRVEGLEMGADAYLTKPYNYRELQAEVTAMLRIKTLTDQLLQRRREIEQKNLELSQMQAELVHKERQIVAMQFAGTAAHNLGQPLTTILFQCSIVEKFLATNSASGVKPSAEQALKAIKAVREQCEGISSIVSQLEAVDVDKTESYIQDLSILSLKGSDKD